ncbi:MAG: electron transporter SenC [Sphingobacteriales bacterium UTBCD1]|jgi:protein SCO1/2|nr:MAG: electron transporter SenC [Sphingobacteriales bacterium UTBCD1]
MGRKIIFYILFFVSLFFVFYFAMGKIIPGFGKKQSATISEVLPFSFINQDGNRVTNKDVSGKVYVAEYFYTTCHGICPRMNNNMKQVYERFKNENDFLILSYTCDPANDSAARLKHYADSMGVSTGRWIFLTGRKDSLYYHARLSYQIDDPKNNLKNIDDDFMHTQFWALVDRNGRVKHIYDGLKQSEVNQMISDIDEMLRN